MVSSFAGEEKKQVTIGMIFHITFTGSILNTVAFSAAACNGIAQARGNIL